MRPSKNTSVSNGSWNDVVQAPMPRRTLMSATRLPRAPAGVAATSAALSPATVTGPTNAISREE
ncbi:MAG: hypothetical protein EBR10_09590 [Planctomycetes bacterium]|nr:hypothetical protein [Planctomycetota bacterium]